MDVSIIIVNYNTCDITKNCINSIFEYTKDIKFEIILVDNNSKDKSYSVFSNDNRITYLYQQNNLGFGKANNLGFKHAKGKYIFLLNSDTLLKSNVVKEFYDYMEKAPKSIACAGTLMKDISNNISNSYGYFPNFASLVKQYTIIGSIFKYILKSKENPLIKNGYVDFISGADLFIRKNVPDSLGLFDPDFFMYFEETEMQFRYNKNGYKSIIYSTPQLIHLEGYSMKQVSKNNRFTKRPIYFHSLYLYYKKCYGNLSYSLFRLIFSILTPFWIIHPKYSLKDKINYIKNTFQPL